MKRLRAAALVAFGVHLVAGLSMAFILRHGLETTLDLQARFAFLVNHRALWTAAWLTWTAAALAILYFYMTFTEAFGQSSSSRFAVWLTVVALGPDLSAQAIEIGVLPMLASQAAGANGGTELFLTLHRVAVMLSGWLANGLYTITALILVWRARQAYPLWVSATGFVVGLSGLALSVAALLNSAAGMFWTNVLLVPGILLWLAALAIIPPGSR